MSAGYYSIHIQVWPHSTGSGAEEDQKACGARDQKFNVHAQDFEDACRQAKLLVAGIRVNPRVWQAPIWSIGLAGAGAAE